MNDRLDPVDRSEVAKLRHELANPLTALVTEVQLALMDSGELADNAVTVLRDVERMALKLRTILQESREQHPD